jgi:hypothetical protein
MASSEALAFQDFRKSYVDAGGKESEAEEAYGKVRSERAAEVAR